MQDELKNILTPGNTNINERQVMDYLTNRLPKSGEYELEKSMADDAFLNDAIEGLEQMKSEPAIQHTVKQLNQGLHRQIHRNGQRREKRRWKDQSALYLAIILLILLLLTAVFVILIIR